MKLILIKHGCCTIDTLFIGNHPHRLLRWNLGYHHICNLLWHPIPCEHFSHNVIHASYYRWEESSCVFRCTLKELFLTHSKSFCKFICNFWTLHRILICTDYYLIHNRKILELSVRHLLQKCLILLCIDELEYNLLVSIPHNAVHISIRSLLICPFHEVTCSHKCFLKITTVLILLIHVIDINRRRNVPAFFS